MLAPDATRVDAASWHLAQHCPVTAVLACGFALSPRPLPRCTHTVTPYGACLTPGAECCIRCNSAPFEVGEPGVAQLVQGLAAGVALEQLLGHLVRQPGPAAGRVQVGLGHHPVRGGPADGEEHRPGVTARGEPGQQPRGGGLKCSGRVWPPLVRARACRLARSRSPRSRPRASSAQAAESYSSRHSARSRSGISDRAHSRSSSGSGIALVSSSGAARRPACSSRLPAGRPCRLPPTSPSSPR